MLNFLKKLLLGDAPDLGEWLDKGAVVIDVRTPAEYKGGHVKGAVNIPLNEVQRRMKKIKAYGKPVITCCASGRRSGMAAKMIQQSGVEAVNGGPWQQVRNAVAHA